MKLDKDPQSPMYNWQASELDSEETMFPWGDVFKSKIVANEDTNLKPCPECEKENAAKRSEGNIIAVFFRSPSITWEHLCGCEGYLTICIKHKKQVDFMPTIIS